MTIADWERVISTMGLPVSLLLVIGFTIRALLKWCRPHAESMVAAHVRLLDTCSTTLNKIESNAAINADRIDELTRHTLDPNGPCQRTVAALGHASYALESLGDTCPEVQRHAQDMRRSLE